MFIYLVHCLFLYPSKFQRCFFIEPERVSIPTLTPSAVSFSVLNQTLNALQSLQNASFAIPFNSLEHISWLQQMGTSEILKSQELCTEPPEPEPEPGRNTSTVSQSQSLRLLVFSFLHWIVSLGLILAMDFLLKKAFVAASIEFPSALFGMFCIFSVLIVLDYFVPSAAVALVNFFEPGLMFIQRWLPLFYVPYLVVLPLSLKDIPPSSAIKISIIIGICMTVISCLLVIVIIVPFFELCFRFSFSFNLHLSCFSKLQSMPLQFSEVTSRLFIKFCI